MFFTLLSAADEKKGNIENENATAADSQRTEREREREREREEDIIMEAAKRRQGALRRHLTGKSEEDVVVVCALRTPITKARKGGLKDTPADDLVAAVLKGVLDKTGKTNLIEKKT